MTLRRAVVSTAAARPHVRLMTITSSADNRKFSREYAFILGSPRSRKQRLRLRDASRSNAGTHLRHGHLLLPTCAVPRRTARWECPRWHNGEHPYTAARRAQRSVRRRMFLRGAVVPASIARHLGHARGVPAVPAG